MTVYLVAYDLNLESKRPNITARLKDLYPWAMLSESAYAVDAAGSERDVFSALADLIDNNDQLYVMPLRGPYSGFGPPDVNQWLDNRLSR